MLLLSHRLRRVETAEFERECVISKPSHKSHKGNIMRTIQTTGIALVAALALLLGATPAAADDNDGDGDEDEVRLEYVDEWLDGTLVNCVAATISYGYELDGFVCDVEAGPWADELETLLGDLDRDKDRERVTDLVYELLVADSECDGLNSVDHVRGVIVDPTAEQKCRISTVVAETDALSCAGQVVDALGGGSASERRGRLHDILFTPEEAGRPALCGQPRVRGTMPSPPTRAPRLTPIPNDDPISRAYREQQGFHNCKQHPNGHIVCDPEPAAG